MFTDVCLQIETCDNILASMEGMLGKFQGDLGNISAEIRSLQEQSQSMSIKLRNRKAAEQKLGTFLDNLAITPALIHGIAQQGVDEDYQVGSHVSQGQTHVWEVVTGMTSLTLALMVNAALCWSGWYSMTFACRVRGSILQNFRWVLVFC